MTIFDKIASSKPLDTRKIESIELNLKDTSSKTINEEVSFVLSKITIIKNHLNQCFLEREDAINNLFITLTTGSNLLLLGPPGTGKSQLITELTKHIEGARMFSWLLNRTSDPTEIIGPFSMKAMEKDQFIRVTDGKLPCAEIVFLDEIFKANEPVLNICLPLINEKILYNGPTPTKVPLISLFAASNEFPDENEGLEALYDRLLLRMWVDYIKEPKHRLELLQLCLKERPACSARITIKEIQILQETIKEVKINQNVLQHLNAIIGELEQKGLKISDRRLVKCLDVLRANALLNKRMKVYTDDLQPLMYVLWEKEEDFEMVQTVIEPKLNPYREELENIRLAFDEIKFKFQNNFQQQSKEQRQFYASADKKIKQLAISFNESFKKASSYGINPAPYLLLKDEFVTLGKEIVRLAINSNK